MLQTPFLVFANELAERSSLHLQIIIVSEFELIRCFLDDAEQFGVVKGDDFDLVSIAAHELMLS